MTLIQIIVLALIQGLTEFLPVSSSAHLILGSRVFGWPDQGLAFDVATHLGTLVAVCWYFRSDLAQMISANIQSSTSDSAHRRLGRLIILASIPALVIGYFAADWVEFICVISGLSRLRHWSLACCSGWLMYLLQDAQPLERCHYHRLPGSVLRRCWP